jgi:hypothetical protein
MLAVAIYATVLKHMGLPLIYPGEPEAFDAMCQTTEASHLARGMVWAATSEHAQNEVFNLTNGVFFGGATRGRSWRTGSGWRPALYRRLISKHLCPTKNPRGLSCEPYTACRLTKSAI